MNNNTHHSNRFMDGFVLGLLIGALAVFLFGTKKGKGILKVISEQGLDGITNILEEYDLADIEEEEEEGKEPTEKPKANGHIAKKAEEVVGKVTETTEEFISVVKDEPSKKRFFKRIRR